MKVSFLFIFIFLDLSECFPAYPLVAAGSSIISLVRDIISKQKAPALAAPTFGLTPAFSEWKPKIMGGEEVYAQKAPFLLTPAYWFLSYGKVVFHCQLMCTVSSPLYWAQKTTPK